MEGRGDFGHSFRLYHYLWKFIAFCLFFFHFSLKFHIRCTHFCRCTLQIPSDCTISRSIWHAIFENFPGEHPPDPPSISCLWRSIWYASIFKITVSTKSYWKPCLHSAQSSHSVSFCTLLCSMEFSLHLLCRLHLAVCLIRITLSSICLCVCVSVR